MNRIFWILAVLFGFSLMACSETKVVDEFVDNWDQRNYAYIDSVANVARANQGEEVGEWKVMRTYKQNEGGLGSASSNQDFVFAKILEKGTGAGSPIFNDTVMVTYRGRLIPTMSYPEGKVFDQNYYGDLNAESVLWAPTSSFQCNTLVEGWTTALMYMHEGDYWRLYIPQDLGYQTKGSTDIPGYSTLIFDIYLKKIKKAAH